MGGYAFKNMLQNTPVDSTKIRTQFGVLKDSVVYLFVGTLIYLKGVDGGGSNSP